MGFERDRFTSEVDASMTCPLCAKVFENPVKLDCIKIKEDVNSLNHVFCRTCIIEKFAELDSLKCPIDGEKFKRNTKRSLIQTPSQPILDTLSKLMIKCDSVGCSTIVQLSQLETHLDTCTFKPKTHSKDPDSRLDDFPAFVADATCSTPTSTSSGGLPVKSEPIRTNSNDSETESVAQSNDKEVAQENDLVRSLLKEPYLEKIDRVEGTCKKLLEATRHQLEAKIVVINKEHAERLESSYQKDIESLRAANQTQWSVLEDKFRKEIENLKRNFVEKEASTKPLKKQKLRHSVDSDESNSHEGKAEISSNNGDKIACFTKEFSVEVDMGSLSKDVQEKLKQQLEKSLKSGLSEIKGWAKEELSRAVDQIRAEDVELRSAMEKEIFDLQKRNKDRRQEQLKSGRELDKQLSSIRDLIAAVEKRLNAHHNREKVSTQREISRCSKSLKKIEHQAKTLSLEVRKLKGEDVTADLLLHQKSEPIDEEKTALEQTLSAGQPLGPDAAEAVAAEKVLKQVALPVCVTQAPVKKRRGRPPKVAPPPLPATTAPYPTAATTPSLPPARAAVLKAVPLPPELRGPGGAEPVATVAPATSRSLSIDAAVIPVVRKRGRPRKNPPPAEPVQPNNSKPSQRRATRSSTSSKSDQETFAKPRRGRARSMSTRLTSSASSTGESLFSEDDTASRMTSPPPPLVDIPKAITGDGTKNDEKSASAKGTTANDQKSTSKASYDIEPPKSTQTESRPTSATSTKSTVSSVSSSLSSISSSDISLKDTLKESADDKSCLADVQHSANLDNCRLRARPRLLDSRRKKSDATDLSLNSSSCEDVSSSVDKKVDETPAVEKKPSDENVTEKSVSPGVESKPAAETELKEKSPMEEKKAVEIKESSNLAAAEIKKEEPQKAVTGEAKPLEPRGPATAATGPPTHSTAATGPRTHSTAATGPPTHSTDRKLSTDAKVAVKELPSAVGKTNGLETNSKAVVTKGASSGPLALPKRRSDGDDILQAAIDAMEIDPSGYSVLDEYIPQSKRPCRPGDNASLVFNAVSFSLPIFQRMAQFTPGHMSQAGSTRNTMLTSCMPARPPSSVPIPGPQQHKPIAIQQQVDAMVLCQLQDNAKASVGTGAPGPKPTGGPCSGPFDSTQVTGCDSRQMPNQQPVVVSGQQPPSESSPKTFPPVDLDGGDVHRATPSSVSDTASDGSQSQLESTSDSTLPFRKRGRGGTSKKPGEDGEEGGLVAGAPTGSNGAHENDFNIVNHILQFEDDDITVLKGGQATSTEAGGSMAVASPPYPTSKGPGLPTKTLSEKAPPQHPQHQPSYQLNEAMLTQQHPHHSPGNNASFSQYPMSVANVQQLMNDPNNNNPSKAMLLSMPLSQQHAAQQQQLHPAYMGPRRPINNYHEGSQAAWVMRPGPGMVPGHGHHYPQMNPNYAQQLSHHVHSQVAGQQQLLNHQMRMVHGLPPHAGGHPMGLQQHQPQRMNPNESPHGPHLPAANQPPNRPSPPSYRPGPGAGGAARSTYPGMDNRNYL